jgi:hypothetical protein
MKLVLRLAILVVALLLVSNMAFADSPWSVADPGVYGTALTTCTGDQMFCYAVTETYENGSFYNWTYKFCLNNVGTGALCNLGVGCVNLTMFGGGPSWFNFVGDPASSGKPNWSVYISSPTAPYTFIGYYQPLGPNLMLTGLEVVSPGNNDIVTGIIVNCP